MSYTVLARRYRSTSFAQVIGQESTAQTLRNAIAQGKVHHAMLFAGTRGVGKTTMARIFARALNAPSTVSDCPSPPDAEQLPPLPVQERMAEAIMRGDDLNVIEIDGASNRKVEDARQLIEGTGLSPTGQARYKIYIIDEVHMLTREAFNTLLKTMEEPPPHVKFILCTTEPHKVPATIQSRCQRFDLRPIVASRIAEHLHYVIKQEKIEADDLVVGYVARLANGSMRDALSLLERLIAAVPADQPRMTYPMLEQLLGLPPQQLIEGLVRALADGDVKQALVSTADLLDRGLAQDQVIEALIEHLHQLMLLSACGPDCELVDLSADDHVDLLKQAERFEPAALVYMIALCDNLQRFSRNSSNPRAMLDATVVRLALAEKMADVTALIRGADAQPLKKKDLSNDQAVNPNQSRSTGQHHSPMLSVDPAGYAAPPSDLGVIWSAVLAAIAERPSMSWVQSLSLQRLDDQVAHLTTVPGRRELLRFVTPQRCHQLAQLFRDVLHRPMRVEIDEPDCGPGDLAASTKDNRDVIDRGKAFSLPMVREVLRQFDAVVVAAHPKQTPGVAGADDLDGSQEDSPGSLAPPTKLKGVDHA